MADAQKGPAGGTRMTSEKPLFLAPKARQGNGHGYVTTPALSMRGEPECVGPAILHGYAEAAAFHRSQQHQVDVATMQTIREQLAAEDRIRDLRRRAIASRVDLTRETHIMERDLARARTGNRKPPARVVTRLQGLEALMDGLAA